MVSQFRKLRFPLSIRTTYAPRDSQKKNTRSEDTLISNLTAGSDCVHICVMKYSKEFSLEMEKITDLKIFYTAQSRKKAYWRSNKESTAFIFKLDRKCN